MNNAVAYEIEIETTGERITEAKQEMQVKSFIIVTYNSHSEEFLRKHSIPFTYSKRSKLHNMLAGSIE